MSPSSRPDSLLRTVEWILALTATALIVFLHATFFTKAGALWRDEVNSIHLAAMPSLGDIWSSLRYDSFPILLSVVLRGWIALGLGSSDAGWRVFGLLVGLGIVAALWLNSWRMSRSAPLLSLTLFGLSPLLIRAGDALRPYGMGTLLILLTAGWVFQVSVSHSRRSAAVALLLAVLSVQCLYQNAVLLLAIGLAGFAVAARQGTWKTGVGILCGGLIAAISLLPYWSRIQTAREWAAVAQQPLESRHLWQRALQALESSETIGWAGGVGETLWLVLPFVLVLAGLCLLRPRSSYLEDSEKNLVLYAIVLFVAACLGYAFFIKLAGVPPQPWYFVPLLGVLATCVDALLATAGKHPRWRWLKAGLAIFLIAIMFVPAREELQKKQTNVDLVARAVAAQADPDDLILVNPWYYAISFHHYYEGTAPVMTIPTLGKKDLIIHRYDLIKQSTDGGESMQPIRNAIEETLKSGHQVWLVGGLVLPGPGGVSAPLPRIPGGGPEPSPIEKVLHRWRVEVGAFVVKHTREPRMLRISPAGVVSNEENLPPVLVLKGWR